MWFCVDVCCPAGFSAPPALPPYRGGGQGYLFMYLALNIVVTCIYWGLFGCDFLLSVACQADSPMGSRRARLRSTLLSFDCPSLGSACCVPIGLPCPNGQRRNGCSTCRACFGPCRPPPPTPPAVLIDVASLGARTHAHCHSWHMRSSIILQLALRATRHPGPCACALTLSRARPLPTASSLLRRRRCIAAVFAPITIAARRWCKAIHKGEGGI